jgi:hypothetical protein
MGAQVVFIRFPDGRRGRCKTDGANKGCQDQDAAADDVRCVEFGRTGAADRGRRGVVSGSVEVGSRGEVEKAHTTYCPSKV